MREILFRGKRTDNNEWVDGCFYQESDCESYIIPSQTLWYVESDGDDFRAVYTAHRVNIDTIGQYTGIKDKNGTKIFEGDIIQYNENGFVFIVGYVVFKDCSFFVRGTSTLWEDCRIHHLDDNTTIEVVGNIHDNQELIEHVNNILK